MPGCHYLVSILNDMYSSYDVKVFYVQCFIFKLYKLGMIPLLIDPCMCVCVFCVRARERIFAHSVKALGIYVFPCMLRLL